MRNGHLSLLVIVRKIRATVSQKKTKLKTKKNPKEKLAARTMSAKSAKPLEIGIAVIRNKKKKVLIIKRLYEEYAKKGQKLTWVFPGGTPDRGESIEETTIRETRLETGLNIRILNLISERTYSQPNVHLKYFACRLKDFKVEPILDVHEVETLKWVFPKELKDYFTTDLDPGVAKYLKI